MSDTTPAGPGGSTGGAFPPPEFKGILKQYRGWFVGLGIAWIVAGVVAIALPFAAAIALDILVGILLALGGAAQIVQSFSCREWNGKILYAAIGLIALIAGAILLANPVQGVLTLTLVLGAFFIAAGIARAMLGFQMKGVPGSGWLLLSAALGIVVGGLIWAGWPGTASWALGLMIGIELIFSGWSLVMLGNAARD